MSLIIRLQKNKYNSSNLHYKIVVIKKIHSVKSKKIIEELGFYDQNLNLINLNFYRFSYWLGRGVFISNSLFLLLFNFFKLN